MQEQRFQTINLTLKLTFVYYAKKLCRQSGHLTRRDASAHLHLNFIQEIEIPNLV